MKSKLSITDWLIVGILIVGTNVAGQFWSRPIEASAKPSENAEFNARLLAAMEKAAATPPQMQLAMSFKQQRQIEVIRQVGAVVREYTVGFGYTSADLDGDWISVFAQKICSRPPFNWALQEDP